MALTLVTSDLILGLDYGKLTGTIPTWNQSTTGNADTATLAAGATILATAIKNKNGYHDTVKEVYLLLKKNIKK